MHPTHVDVFGNNHQNTAATTWTRKMSRTYGSCFTPAGLLYCLVVLLLHRIPSSVANGKVTSSHLVFIASFFCLTLFCLCVWAGLGKSCSLVSLLLPNKMYVALNHEEQHHTTSFLQSSFLFPLPTSICPDKSVADAHPPPPHFSTVNEKQRGK